MQNSKIKEQQKKKKPVFMLILCACYALFIAGSFLFKYEAGIQIGENFGFFALDMIKLLPPAFILVGLFMVWISRETVEQYFGEASGAAGYLAAILLACTTLYPFVVVIPMANALSQKGARLSIVLTYLGATAVCRIPMTIFEASFLGVKFTIIRYLVSLPLIVLSSIIIEKMVGRDYLHANQLISDSERAPSVE